MRKIKTYSLFIEEAEFDVKVTDQPDIKGAKEGLIKLRKDLADYKSKKALIDNAYLKIAIDNELQTKIDEIVGKENKNPFLVEYLHVASLKRKVDKIQKDIANDKIKKDDFTQELKLSKDDTTKQAVNLKITDITNRISTNSANIASLTKEISDAQSALDKKMINAEKNMIENIKKISTQS